ncbi:MarR family transcriptional regulator [Leucobacter allii]|uniref:MarR family transcriptional regulator n=1 Tax=Leucobacter allii TaxID=2932247 RepID=A0ABY4FL37_9MICO|nr:MarR family transcriptional regulator [Leucobacter allii]UOQ56979.1 MarR family transcriptional regulator [Leucobacter allii]UOR01449.1 MarR family transcriptional regulator [Leucobacter allii]
MADSGATPGRDAVSERLYDIDSSDPRSELVDRSDLDREDIAQIGRLMQALSGLRDAERALAQASERYMRLSAQDMRALHYLIVAKNRQEIVTPGRLAAHLKISPASTTKLLNRLERGGHVMRNMHPSDRRAFAIAVTAETEHSAMQTLGKQQSRRFLAAARLTRDEREVVIGFLTDMTQELSLRDVAWAGEDAAGGAGVGSAAEHADVTDAGRAPRSRP